MILIVKFVQRAYKYAEKSVKILYCNLSVTACKWGKSSV